MGYLMLILNPCSPDHRILHQLLNDTYIILLKFLVFQLLFEVLLHINLSWRVLLLGIHFHFAYLSFISRVMFLLLPFDINLLIRVLHCKELPLLIDHSFHHSQIFLWLRKLGLALLLFGLIIPILFSFFRSVR